MPKEKLLQIFAKWLDEAPDHDVEIFFESSKWKVCLYRGTYEQTIVHKDLCTAIELGLKRWGHI